MLSLITSFGIGILFVVFFNNGFLSEYGLIWIGSILTGLSVSWIGWQYLEWSNELFFFTNKRIINFQQSLLSFETKQETPLVAIESIQARKSFFSRALGFGDLEVRTYTGSIRIPYVPEIYFVEKIITHLLSRSRNLLGNEEKQAFEEVIRERITRNSSFDSLNKSDDQNSIPNQSYCEVSNDVNVPGKYKDIVYHTHWTILFSKIFIQIALIFAHAFLYLFFVANQYILIKSNIFNVVITINCIILIYWCSYRFIDWRNDVFIITEDQLIDIDRHPFGMEDKKTAPIKNIQLIRYKRNGILGLILNYGTVFILVGDEEFTFNNVHRPANVQETIFSVKDRYHRITQEIKAEAERKKAVDWIDSYHRVASNLRENDQRDNKDSDTQHIK